MWEFTITAYSAEPHPQCDDIARRVLVLGDGIAYMYWVVSAREREFLRSLLQK